MTCIEDRLYALKTEFSNITFLIGENTQLFESLREKIIKLQAWYEDYVSSHKDNLFIFGLDCFHYQAKIIDVEYDDMKRIYSSITNRMYCEYFKLHQIIVNYVQRSVKDKNILDIVQNNNNFPMYKDLEPYKQYGMSVIMRLHDIILLLCNGIKNVIDAKEEELRLHRVKSDLGFNIDNFVQTLNFDKIVLEQKLILFISYAEFFHKLHTKYLRRFTGKMTLFSSQIDNDIRIDSGAKTKERRKSMMAEFKNDNIDAGLMRQLTDNLTSTSGDSESAGRVIDTKILGENPFQTEIDSPPPIESQVCDNASVSTIGDGSPTTMRPPEIMLVVDVEADKSDTNLVDADSPRPIESQVCDNASVGTIGDGSPTTMPLPEIMLVVDVEAGKIDTNIVEIESANFDDVSGAIRSVLSDMFDKVDPIIPTDM